MYYAGTKSRVVRTAHNVILSAAMTALKVQHSHSLTARTALLSSSNNQNHLKILQTHTNLETFPSCNWIHLLPDCPHRHRQCFCSKHSHQHVCEKYIDAEAGTWANEGVADRGKADPLMMIEKSKKIKTLTTQQAGVFTDSSTRNGCLR